MPTLIWLRRAALRIIGGNPDSNPSAQATSNTVTADVPGMDVFKILKTTPPIGLGP